MIRRIRIIASIVLPLTLLVAGCGTTAEQQSPAPQATTVASGATQAPAAEATPVVASEPTPTVAPTITTGPTATAFPLSSGWWDDAVCYEVFVRSFYDSDGDGNGDLRGLIEKLDYLNDGDEATTNDLGVNCVWLMPVMESPSYHGYDVTDYRTIEPDYGTNDDFKALVAAAHERGIYVIIDLVLNHVSREHAWFKEASGDPASQHRDWFIWSKTDPGYLGPWGEQVWHRSGSEYFYGIFWDGMPDLNYRNPAVTEEAHAITRFWVEEMGVDGFRLDAIKHVVENGNIQENTPETHAWLRDYRTFLQSLGRPVFTVGEIFDGSLPVLSSYFPDQLDTFFSFNIAGGIIQSINTGKAGGVMAPAKSTLAGLPFQRFAPFLTNHDQDRVMSLFGSDVSKAKLAATALLTLPGLPFMYYGEEIGMLGAKPDERIRTPMQWNGDENGGFTQGGKTWQAFQENYKEVNVAAQDQDAQSLLSHYRRVVQLHRSHPALGHGDFIPLESSDNSVAAYVRHVDGEAVLVVLNFNKEARDGVSFSLAESPLAEGGYQLEPLLDETQATPLTIGSGGAISEAVPLPSLAARTGYIFRLGQ